MFFVWGLLGAHPPADPSSCSINNMCRVQSEGVSSERHSAAKIRKKKWAFAQEGSLFHSKLCLDTDERGNPIIKYVKLLNPSDYVRNSICMFMLKALAFRVEHVLTQVKFKYLKCPKGMSEFKWCLSPSAGHWMSNITNTTKLKSHIKTVTKSTH